MFPQRRALMVNSRALAALFAVMAVGIIPRWANAQVRDTSAIVSPAIAALVPPTPDTRHPFVLDSAHIFSTSEIEALQDSARLLLRATRAQVVIVTLRTLGSVTPNEVANGVRRIWHVGQGTAPTNDMARNRGIVVLIVPDRSSSTGGLLHFDIGRGLAASFPDSSAAATLDAIKPLFRERRYGTSLVAGFRVMSRLIRADLAAKQAAMVFPPPRPIDFMSTRWPMRIAVGLFLAGVLTWVGVWLLGIKRKRDSRLNRKHRTRSVPHQGMLLPARRLPASDEVMRSHERTKRQREEHSGGSKPASAGDGAEGGGHTPRDKGDGTR